MTTTEERAMEFITDVVVGDGTPFTFNGWNAAIEWEGQHHVATAQGRTYDGRNVGFTTRKGALNKARDLQSIRYPGEDIFLVDVVTLPDSDADETHHEYYVVGPVACDTFSRWTEN
jgi:hypothetical protein